ncbi:nucleotidyltransferase [Niallia sp. MER 6]|uniref:nucleotidyltransferase domain-containing protein n=1 Tax=Niallia sp. MER 6 TaxID=2939567 RepID=UPI00203E07E1|nr:nucleotidyltransferase [Niallia sp. MER 6]MCM3029830.1 nucleotidyltransferase [Niallia sp. MER 6]
MNNREDIVLKELVERLDLPDSAYEKAEKRYKDLGEWFNRDNSKLSGYNVHIFPQGSFLLGTAIRPINEEDEYDLDLACKLRQGISKSSHTQEELKTLVGEELEAYRKARGILEPLVPKHRCWRLEYHDDISFHLDIVPAIPLDDFKKSMLFEAMNMRGTGESVAKGASEKAISITDDRDPNYKKIIDEWNISNPEGYSIWFNEQNKTTENYVLLEKAQVDKVPLYKQKSPLQRCIQILKRHRDIMFGDDESKPISIIITTLAARAYNGESDIYVALSNILEKMAGMINNQSPRVPNPVNPEEDFADRWAMPECIHLNLEENFKIWLQQARRDYNSITTLKDPVLLTEAISKSFSISINSEELKKKLGLSNSSTPFSKPKDHYISEPAKPWKQKM